MGRLRPIAGFTRGHLLRIVDVRSVLYAAPLVRSLEDACDAADPLYRLKPSIQLQPKHVRTLVRCKLFEGYLIVSSVLYHRHGYCCS